MKKLLALYFVVVLFTSCGCGSTESMKKSVFYDGKALEAVDEKLASIENSADATPVIISTAKAARVEVTNVRVSIPLIQSEVGEPNAATTPPYTPEEHAKTNAAAKKELEDKAGLIDTVWNFAQTTSGKITAALGLGALGFTIIGWVRSATWSGKLWEYAKIAGSLVSKSKDLKEQFVAKAVDHGVPKEIRAVVEALPAPSPVPVVVVEEKKIVEPEAVIVEPAKPPA